MLLVIDVGNTNTVVGVYVGARLAGHWRVESRRSRTADELGVLLRELFALAGLPWAEVRTGIIACVVPPALYALEEMFRVYRGITPQIVGPGTRTGMPILYDNPHEVGADRVVNAVAAYERYHGGAIVVDFGTATTFDVVTPRGEYLGGVIAPGITVSADALYHAAAKLPRVEIVRPRSVIGKNTVASMQAGLVFGYAGMVDAIVGRILAEVDFQARVIATGGLAPLIARESRTIEETDEMLTLEGLRLIHERNQ